MKENQTNETDMRRPLYGGYDSAAEFVTPGHPDKTCDQIAGKILDAALVIDENARVAIEMVACNGNISIGGEFSDSVFEDFDQIKLATLAKTVFTGLGYGDDFVIKNVLNITTKQSPAIWEGNPEEQKGVVSGGAGDQGVMCGYAMYAPDREHMPAAFWYSQRLAMQLFKVAVTEKTIPGLYADGKTQVIIKNGKVSHVTIAIHHNKDWNGKQKQKELEALIKKHVIDPVVGKVDTIIVNGCGQFDQGSIWADAAEVGRKIVVDQMGPDIPVGGGTLNGKDPSKVDLTAAVMARYIAKNIVAHKLADEALVQFAFTIGQLEPDQINIYAPGWKLDMSPKEWVSKNFETSAAGMIKELGMKKPAGWSYEEAAKFGYYGHPQFPWERIKKLG